MEGKVERDVKGGYEVRIGGARGFCPFSQIDTVRTADPAQHDLVRSLRGQAGGFRLARAPDDITLADIIRAIDGPLASVRGIRPEDVDRRRRTGHDARLSGVSRPRVRFRTPTCVDRHGDRCVRRNWQ